MQNCIGCHVSCAAIGALEFGYRNCSGLAGKSPSLLEVRGSEAELGTLQGEQAFNSSPETPKCGKREALPRPPAQEQLVFPNFPSFTMQLIFMESSWHGDGWISF